MGHLLRLAFVVFCFGKECNWDWKCKRPLDFIAIEPNIFISMILRTDCSPAYIKVNRLWKPVFGSSTQNKFMYYTREWWPLHLKIFFTSFQKNIYSVTERNNWNLWLRSEKMQLTRANPRKWRRQREWAFRAWCCRNGTRSSPRFSPPPRAC